MRLYELTGDRAALAPLIDASYDDWNGGKVDADPPRRPARDRHGGPPRRQLEGRQRRPARRRARRPARDRAPTSTGATCCSRSTTPPTPRPASATCSRSTPTTPTPTSGWRGSRSSTATTAPTARDEIARALAVNPVHAGALALRARAGARRRGLSRPPRRTWPPSAAPTRAIPARPGSRRRPRCCSTIATPTRARASTTLAVHPNDGAFFAFVAEALIRHRRYDDARAVAEAGVAANPDDAACLAVLATTLLRLGDEERGPRRPPARLEARSLRRPHLQPAQPLREGDPGRYAMVASAHLRFRVVPAAPRRHHRGGRALPRGALPATTSPATASSPRGRSPSSSTATRAHFAVRTVGLPGIGVAGVCFGRVITSQSPTNHAFNWGMVLAHELAHVFAIELSRSRVPALVHRGAVRGRDDARPSRVDAPRRRRALRRLSCAASCPTLAEPVERVRQRAQRRRRAPAPTPTRRWRSTSWSGASASGPCARRWPPTGGASASAAVLEQLAGMPLAALERAFRDDLAQAVRRAIEAQYLPTQLAQAAAARSCRRVGGARAGTRRRGRAGPRRSATARPRPRRARARAGARRATPVASTTRPTRCS